MAGVFILAGILLCVVVFLLRREGLRRVGYRRYFSEAGVFEGESVQLVEEIENGWFVPLFLNVDAYLYRELCLPGFSHPSSLSPSEKDENEKSAVGLQEFTSRFFLAPYTRVRRSIPIECAKRGYYELDSVYVQNKSRLAKTQLFVYPRALPYSENRTVENQQQNMALSDRRLLQDPFSFAGVRDYRPGDPFRSINYKATAKTGALKVNERDYFSGRNFMVYIDFHANGAEGYEDMMEKSLSYAADMVWKSIKDGYNVGFAANCKRLLGRENHVRYALRRGEKHYKEMLQEMAAIRISEGCSFLWLLQQDLDTLLNTDVYIMSANALAGNAFDSITAALWSRGNNVTVVGYDGF